MSIDPLVREARRLLKSLGVKDVEVKPVDEASLRRVAEQLLGAADEDTIAFLRRLMEQEALTIVCTCDDQITVAIGGRATLNDARRAALKAYILSRAGDVAFECKGGDCIIQSVIIDLLSDLAGKHILGADYWEWAKRKMWDAVEKARGHEVVARLLRRVYETVYEGPAPEIDEAALRMAEDPRPEVVAELLNRVFQLAGIRLRAKPQEGRVKVEVLPLEPPIN